jgi:Tfp pilus assembly protein PilE
MAGYFPRTPQGWRIVRALQLAGLLAVLLVGYYIYSAHVAPVPAGVETVRQMNLVAVRQDLLSLAQAERQYLAMNGRYAGLEQLRQSGIMGSVPENRQGYVYEVEPDGAAHFRITARPASAAAQGLPTLSIDETMQITR